MPFELVIVSLTCDEGGGEGLGAQGVWQALRGGSGPQLWPAALLKGLSNTVHCWRVTRGVACAALDQARAA